MPKAGLVAVGLGVTQEVVQLHEVIQMGEEDLVAEGDCLLEVVDLAAVKNHRCQ